MIDLLFSNLNILTISLIFFGVAFGILVSAIPGLTTTIGVVLLLPFSFYLDSASSLGMLMGVFVGGMAGGCNTSDINKYSRKSSINCYKC